MNIDLYQLIDMVHVPAVNREIAETVTKWLEKGIAEAEIKEYYRRKSEYYDKLYIGPRQRLLEEQKDGLTVEPSFFWFELQRYDEFVWRILYMVPFEEAYNHQYEILPTNIIEKIAEFLVDPEKVITMKGVRSTLLDKVVDVEFVRFSENQVFGTVFGTVNGQGPVETRWDGDLDTAFQAFFDYRNKFPEKVLDFTAEFTENLMPALLEEEPKPGTSPPGTVCLQVDAPGLDILPPKGLSGPGEDGTDVNLFRLILLSQVPEFKQLLSVKLEGLKYGPFKDAVTAYEEKKYNYMLKLFLHMGIEFRDTKKIKKFKQRARTRRNPKTGKIKNIPKLSELMEFLESDGSPQTYWFELSKFMPDDWGVTRVYPPHPPVDTHKEVLPPSLFDRITDTPVDRRKVIRDTLVTPDLLEKKVEVLWVRYSSNCVMGVVRENIDEWLELLTEKKDFLAANPGKKKAAYYHLLFHHMRKHPEVAKSFITTFMSEIGKR
jgi:hypothetical protein